MSIQPPPRTADPRDPRDPRDPAHPLPGRLRQVLARALLAAGVLVGAAGCSTLAVPPPPAVAPLLRDAAFAAPAQAPDPAAVFAASEAMRRFLAGEDAALRRAADPRRALLERLGSGSALGLRYDAGHTRTAAEAFDDRAGNCLSLVLMTASLARALDLPVRFQQVEVAETWSRSGDLQFASGHVNLALEPLPLPARRGTEGGGALVVDFLPEADLRNQRSRTIAEATVLAMYFNNRAAEHLADGALSEAYWQAREAVRQDPRLAIAWNTLGVVYLRSGRADDALRIFDAVLVREPDNTRVLGNRVQALRAAGREAEAEATQRRLAAIEPVPPFHHLDAGIALMRAGDWRGAREQLRRELRRQPDYHETHFRLAQVELALGDARAARRHLEQAQTSSTTLRDAALYAGKLDHLRTLMR